MSAAAWLSWCQVVCATAPRVGVYRRSDGWGLPLTAQCICTCIHICICICGGLRGQLGGQRVLRQRCLRHRQPARDPLHEG